MVGDKIAVKQRTDFSYCESSVRKRRFPNLTSAEDNDSLGRSFTGDLRLQFSLDIGHL